MSKIIYASSSREKKLRDRYLKKYFISRPQEFEKYLSGNAETVWLFNNAKDLLDFYLLTKKWAIESIVCLDILPDAGSEWKHGKYTNGDIFDFFQLYFFDFANRLYIFNEWITELMTKGFILDEKLVEKFRTLESYKLFQEKFRRNYTHNLKGKNFMARVSLITGDLLFTYDKSGTSEVYKPRYIKKLIEQSLSLIRKITLDTIRSVMNELNTDVKSGNLKLESIEAASVKVVKTKKKVGKISHPDHFTMERERRASRNK